MANYPIIGKQYLFDFGKEAKYQLAFKSERELEVTVVADRYFKPGTLNHFEIQISEIRPLVYMITWEEPESGNTVTHVDDFENHVAYTNITNMPAKAFWHLKGTITEK